ncbi:hypothetical protein DMENIID0001_105120 [Sergentomyia squamirostris]
MVSLILLLTLSALSPLTGTEWVKISMVPGKDGEVEVPVSISKSQFLRDTLLFSENKSPADFRVKKIKKSDQNHTWVTKKGHPIAVSWISATQQPETTTETTTKAPELTTVATTEPKTTERMESVKITAKPEVKNPRNPQKLNRGFDFSGLLNFLKNIQESFMSKTKRSIGDKLKYLQTIRDKLLIEIEKRITALWPPDAPPRPPPKKRSKRHFDLSSGSEGHMEFPSSEGALMTICFLTFAVFLIKLVLHVINTIKSKHYSFNGFDTKAPSAAPIKIIKTNRNARKFSLTNEGNLKTMANIMDAIRSTNGKF